MKGRGAGFNPPNRFETLHLDPVSSGEEEGDGQRELLTAFYRDTSKTILAKNDSPDIPFTYSLNPYRGCEHGCIYCYARPSHEYLGFSAGIDFETKIMVKLDAPELLEKAFRSRSWQADTVSLSGNTDCYQPVERRLRLTRRCLEVFLRFRNPVGIVTKNALVLRDLDILRELARLNLIHVVLSMGSLDAALVRALEPRTSTPQQRLRAVRELATAGVPAGVLAAPVIPGLTDEELPSVLKAAADHGASFAGYTLLRLPGAVEPLFIDWLKRTLPDRAAKVISRIKDTRRGRMSEAAFGTRMWGEGETAKAIEALYDINARKYGLKGQWRELSTDQFRREPPAQLDMFDQ